jgi:hypothetical protein
MTSARQPGNPSDARERVVDIYEAKTREIPRPAPPAMPRPWRRIDEGTYALPHTDGVAGVVHRSNGCVDIDALDDPDTLLRLGDLLGWLARGGDAPHVTRGNDGPRRNGDRTEPAEPSRPPAA